MDLYHVYILRCRDGSYYTGVTNNIERRLLEHCAGENPNCYTATRLPVELVFSEAFGDINQAIAFEKQVKGWRRAKKEALITRRWNLLPELSKTAKLSELPKSGSTGSPRHNNHQRVSLSLSKTCKSD